MGIRGELFTTQVVLDNRTYFFNVKENRTGDVFLQVVESKKGDGADFSRHQVAIFFFFLQKFLKGLDQSVSFIEKDRKDRAKKAAEKKAAKEAKYAPHSSSAETGTRKVYRKKSKTENDEHLYTPQLKKTGKVHVVSKRTKTEK